MATWWKLEFTGDPTGEDLARVAELVVRGFTSGHLGNPHADPVSDRITPGPGSRAGDWILLDRITIEPGKMGGQPCIRGQRLTVDHLLGLVGAGGWTPEQRSRTLERIQVDFPFVEPADIEQAAAYSLAVGPECFYWDGCPGARSECMLARKCLEWPQVMGVAGSSGRRRASRR